MHFTVYNTQSTVVFAVERQPDGYHRTDRPDTTTYSQEEIEELLDGARLLGHRIDTSVPVTSCAS